MALLKAIREHSTQVIGAQWCPVENYLKPFYTKEVPADYGIYIIASGFDILKIGKASGKNGLRQRLSAYTRHSYYSPTAIKNDGTCRKMAHEFSTTYADHQIDIHIINLVELSPVVADPILGGTIILDPVRAYEKKFTALAIDEGHPLCLMTQLT